MYHNKPRTKHNSEHICLSPTRTISLQFFCYANKYMEFTLESYRVFPFVAWVLVIGFALFTYMLTVRLQENLRNVDTSLEEIEMRLEKLEKRSVG